MKSRCSQLLTQPLLTAKKQLLELALQISMDYVHTHTHLLVRSLEWQKQGQDGSYLLRGSGLADAQQWLTQGINKEPGPTR